MEQKVFIFGEDCINKNTFHKNKRPIGIDKVDVRRIVLSSKYSYGNKGSFKYFIGYIYIGNVFPIPLCIKIPQMNGYVKYFDNNNKYINFSVHDKKLLWDKIGNLFKKGFDSEPVYTDKHIKTKKQIFNNRVYENFQGNKIPKDIEYCTCLTVILLDSISVNSDKKHPKIFLEESK